MATQARAAVYLTRQATRCVAPLPGGDTGRHRFAVATCALQQRNEIHVVEFVEETSEVVCRQVLPHQEEVWLLTVSPNDGNQILTYSAGKSPPMLNLFTVPEPDAQEQALERLCSISGNEAQLAAVKSALWDPHRAGNLLVADSEALHVFDYAASAGSQPKELSTVQVGQRCSGACLDPHHASQVSTVDDTHIKTWDLRSGKLAFRKDGAHLFGARDVDYNPNVPYQVLTTGEDAALRFWDLRKMDKCLRSLSGGHHHWVARARYNGHHDQLVLSCGTDSAVCLWRCASVASAPLGEDVGGVLAPAAGASAAPSRPPDGLIKRYEEHEDSCYSCCWSASDAWVFASVGYDGRVVVNRVPGEEKYRILL